MASTDLGACEWFVWNLQRSNLIDRGQLDQIVGEFLKTHPRAEPPDLANYLIKEKILTPYQCERVLQDKAQGLVLGPYTLTDALGSGSMGTVYEAISKNDNQWYAVKVLPRRSMWNVRIARRQVRDFERCKHPAVVPFVDVGTAGGAHYLAWPLVDGVTLETIVQQNGKLDPSLAAYYALQTAEGLDVCHQAGLIHGLIKPSNLMVTEDNKIRILDYGIGSLLTESGEGESLVDTMSTANTMTSGLDCASPESIMDPTARTPAGDQYSLGCAVYYCLTGQYPFPEGTAVEKMMAHQTQQAKPAAELEPDVPQELSDMVDRLMQKAPESRYASTAELVAVLREFVEAHPAPQERPAVTIAPKVAPDLAAAAAAGQRGDNGKAKEVAPAPAALAPSPSPRSAAPAPPRTAPSSLPSRDSMRRAPAAAPKPAAEKEAVEERREPEREKRPASAPASEEKLGKAGTVILAVVVAVGAFIVMLFVKDYLDKNKQAPPQPAPIQAPAGKEAAPAPTPDQKKAP